MLDKKVSSNIPAICWNVRKGPAPACKLDALLQSLIPPVQSTLKVCGTTRHAGFCLRGAPPETRFAVNASSMWHP